MMKDEDNGGFFLLARAAAAAAVLLPVRALFSRKKLCTLTRLLFHGFALI